MSLLTIIAELWRFIKDNILKILIGAVVVMALTIGARVLLTNYIENSAMETATTETGANADVKPEEIEASYKHLMEVYDQEPAEFSFVGINEEGLTLANSFIIDEFLTRPDVLAEIEQASGVDIAPTLEAESNVGLQKSKNFRGGIASVRNQSTEEITIRVLVGQTPEENLAVAEAIYEYIQEDKVPFLSNYDLVILTEPDIGEDLILEENPMVPTTNVLAELAPQGSNSQLIFYAVIGLILGFILSTVILFITHFFSKKIVYAYDYNWDLEDYQTIVSADNVNIEALNNWLIIPKEKRRIALAQYTDSTIIQDFSTKYLPVATQLNGADDTPEEIIIFIESGKTDKEWYQVQFDLSKLYESRVKIIHFK